ncbi:MAG TPA: hypothetical protein DDY13_13580 [Cytophagales bacterium]|jgi:hypothetical protein|nr:hypothetical protein [Cytophagales bacterium]
MADSILDSSSEMLVFLPMFCHASIEIALKIAGILDVSLDCLTGKTDVEMDKYTQKCILEFSKFKEAERDHIRDPCIHLQKKDSVNYVI